MILRAQDLDASVCDHQEEGEEENQASQVRGLYYCCQGWKPPYVKLSIFSEFMENSTKFMKNSGLTKWTQNLR